MKIPSSIGFIVVLAAGLFAVESVVFGPGALLTPSDTAMIGNAGATTATALAAPVTPFSITPGLLPQVTMLPKDKTVVAAAIAAGKKAAATSASASVVTPAPKPAVKPSAPATSFATAQSILDATVINVKERRDGPYVVSFTAGAGTPSAFSWNLTDNSIGGTGTVPQFSISHSCTPLPYVPASTEADQNPTFSIRTSYACTESLTPLSGTDRRPVTKQFSFTTDPGQFIVMPPSSMDTILVDGGNNGGFSFANNDTRAVTLTGLTIDISYVALNTATGPLVLRFTDPVTGDSLHDEHLEGIPQDPSLPFTHTATNIQIPVLFKIPPSSQKMIPVSVLGVHKMSITGVDPTVKITIRGVSIDSGNKVVLSLPTIAWSCVVLLGSYDPNATSGPSAAPNICRQ